MTVEARLWHFDGRNARRWQVRLVGDAQGFRLIADDWESGPWHWDDLVALDMAGPDAVFGHRTEEGWRIGFAGDAPSDIAPLLPGKQRYGGVVDRFGLGKASIAFAAIAAAVIFVGVKAPAWLAPLVPQSWEDKLGDTMVGDFGGRYCHTPQGDAALKALVAQMDPKGSARSIEVANIPMINAIALPGRRIILFDGFVQSAESPDEIAGVLGHELGHVQHRHTLTALMRQLGLSVILGGVDGNLGANISSLMGLSFSRDAEHQADETAIAGLGRANISPQGTAQFFERMGGERNEKPGKGKKKAPQKPDNQNVAEKKADTSIDTATNWFASHPTSGSRQQLFTQAVKKDHEYQVALSPAQWKALRSMCAQDKDVKSGWGF
ncbi:MAG: M48 family metallopeptidase [Sphingobium sp.]|nr:M48 family metallopeptidase [Sphingobium sp.]